MGPKGSVKLQREVGDMRKGEPSATNQDLEQLATLFRLLSDKTRLNILVLLNDGEYSVGEICRTLHLPQPTASHHLGLLRMNNVTDCRRAGKQVFYSLTGRRNDGADLLAMECHKFSIRVTAKL